MPERTISSLRTFWMSGSKPWRNTPSPRQARTTWESWAGKVDVLKTAYRVVKHSKVEVKHTHSRTVGMGEKRPGCRGLVFK